MKEGNWLPSKQGKEIYHSRVVLLAMVILAVKLKRLKAC